MRNIPIRRMVLEEVIFALPRILQGLLRIDVLLAAVDHTDEAEFEGVHAPRKDVQRVRASVHDIKLSKHANGTPPLRVDGARELEGVGVGEVSVGGGDGEDYTRVGRYVSVLLGEGNGKKNLLGFEMYSRTRLRIWRSMSLGWSPTGI